MTKHKDYNNFTPIDAFNNYCNTCHGCGDDIYKEKREDCLRKWVAKNTILKPGYHNA